jgi:hypothetical protein
VAVAALVIVAVLVAAARGSSGGGNPATRAVSVVAGPVQTVELQGVPGQVTILGRVTSRVTLTGELHSSGAGTVVASQRDNGRVLRLYYRCAAATSCTESLLLVVPWRTAIVLRQPAGHVVMSGLAGPLRITASNVDISATGLRSPSMTASITSGHLSAAFAKAPGRVGIMLLSSQATLRLPASVRYAVRSQVTSGYVQVGLPQASRSAHLITVRIVSGELSLLPNAAAQSR